MRKWLLAASLLPALVGQSRLTPPNLAHTRRTQSTGTRPKWTLQYFFDENDKELRIADMVFPSATRGIAVGTIFNRKGRLQHTAVVTSDGGEHWSLVPLKEAPRSIFFLNELAGWMVTDDGLWFTDEAGRSWKRLSKQIRSHRPPWPGLLLRVWFLDPQHGFGVGLQKSIYETRDGGRTWKPVGHPGKSSAGAADSAYSQVAFADEKRGLIAGNYVPPGADAFSRGLPEWFFPERALNRVQQPLSLIEMETRDGGANWKTGTVPVFGSIERLRVGASNGLAVFSYGDSFDWPSEVYRLDLTTGHSQSVFKQKDRRVTDVAIFPNGSTILAAIEPPGRLRSAPIPGKVKMMTSLDLKTWREMAVDYRAVARSLVLAAPDREHMWVATDTGMILHWVNPAAAQ